MEAVLPPPWKQAIRGSGTIGKDIVVILVTNTEIRDGSERKADR